MMLSCRLTEHDDGIEPSGVSMLYWAVEDSAGAAIIVGTGFRDAPYTCPVGVAPESKEIVLCAATTTASRAAVAGLTVLCLQAAMSCRLS